MEKTIQYRQTMFVFPAILIIHYFKGALFQIFLYGFLLFFSQELWMSLRLDIYLSILGVPGADSGGEGKSKRAEKYGTKKSKERREEPLGTMSYETSSKRSPPFCLLIGQKNTNVFWHQSEGRIAPTIAPTICPWVSEDDICQHKRNFF